MCMAKVSVNIPDEELERMDKFVEENPGYRNRSEFIREAVKRKMEDAYQVMEDVSGSWSTERAEKAREKLKELEEEDIEVQRAEN